MCTASALCMGIRGETRPHSAGAQVLRCLFILASTAVPFTEVLLHGQAQANTNTAIGAAYGAAADCATGVPSA